MAADDTTPPGELGYRAAVHVLRAAQRDPRGLGYHVGPCTESFELLCRVVAAHDREDLPLVRARWGEVSEEELLEARPRTRVVCFVELDEDATRDAIGKLVDLVEVGALVHEADAEQLVEALDSATLEAAR